MVVQGRLKVLGYYDHAVNGIWGPMSAGALADFRQKIGLGSDAIWDMATQSALLGN